MRENPFNFIFGETFPLFHPHSKCKWDFSHLIVSVAHLNTPIIITDNEFQQVNFREIFTISKAEESFVQLFDIFCCRFNIACKKYLKEETKEKNKIVQNELVFGLQFLCYGSCLLISQVFCIIQQYHYAFFIIINYCRVKITKPHSLSVAQCLLL